MPGNISLWSPLLEKPTSAKKIFQKESVPKIEKKEED